MRGEKDIVLGRIGRIDVKRVMEEVYERFSFKITALVGNKRQHVVHLVVEVDDF